MRHKILVVEDDWLTLRLIKLKLEKKGYEVITARNEKEFWDRAFHEEVELIIVDICLKNRIGTEIYKALLEFGLNGKLPVIFTSGLVSERVKAVGKMPGKGCTFIPKPIDFNVLFEEVERMLQPNTATACHFVSAARVGV